MKPYNTQKSKALYEQTKKYLLGGVASSFHKGATEEYPVCFSHGKGSRLYDVDGNEYIDYIGGLCAMMMGYSSPILNDALREQMNKGTHFAATTPELVKLAKLLTEVIPCAELVGFENSGTEANMYAWRLARAYTGKIKIIKFEGQYHGWTDEQKISIDAASIRDLGKREKPARHMTTKGQRRAAADDVIVIPWNDLEVLKMALELHQKEAAAVVMEPFMCDNGPIPPLPGYLEGARELTRKFGVLLIFDEVITGFRLSLGGAQGYYGVLPDLAIYGKAVTSGFTMAVIAGRREVMTCGVPASGTFNGHPFAASAAIAAITEYRKPDTYGKLEKIGIMFAEGLKELGRKYKKPLITEVYGGLVSLTFTEKERIVDFRDWLTDADGEFYNLFNAACRKYGVRLTHKKGRLCISLAHTEEDILKTLEIMEQAFIELT
jgi:glutamate-1-semialdehyde 2,1-aminomutase